MPHDKDFAILELQKVVKLAEDATPRESLFDEKVRFEESRMAYCQRLARCRDHIEEAEVVGDSFVDLYDLTVEIFVRYRSQVAVGAINTFALAIAEHAKPFVTDPERLVLLIEARKIYWNIRWRKQQRSASMTPGDRSPESQTSALKHLNSDPWTGRGRKPDRNLLRTIGPILKPYSGRNLESLDVEQICEEYDRARVKAPNRTSATGDGWCRDTPRRVWRETNRTRPDLVRKRIQQHKKLLDKYPIE